jgi:excisionase family DNA binding protein
MAAKMAKRVALSKSQLATHGSSLLALCQRVTEQGILTKDGIKDVLRWLNANREIDLPAKEFLLQTVREVVGDRAVTREEADRLHQAIEAVMPPSYRKVAVQKRKAVKREAAKAKKSSEKQRKQAEREKKLTESGIVLLTATNGKKYQLHSLVGNVEYGHETIQDLERRLGHDVAAIVAREVKARERRITGYIVRETEGGAWLIRLTTGGDCFLPIRSVRILSGSPPGPLEIAVPPSLVADIDRQSRSRQSLLTFTTREVADRFGVSAQTVLTWIRDGKLAADQISNGGALFEYRIPESEVLRMSTSFRR